jgi:hypothetical protein
VAEQNRLERRSALLANRIDAGADALAKQWGAGDRPAYTTAMSRSEALAWWRKELYTPAGAEALQRLSPVEIIQLHADLGAAMNGEGPGATDR